MTPLKLKLTISVNGKSYTLFIHAHKGEPASFHCPGESLSWEIIDVVNERTYEQVPYLLWSSFELLYKDEIEEAIRHEACS